jgi:inward rectifier potassium channel
MAERTGHPQVAAGGWPAALEPWRNPYEQLLALRWRDFLGLVTALYLLIHLLFAGLYLLDPVGIGGTGSHLPLLLEAYFFSVETMATIGYGALYPLSLWVHVVMTAEALTGLILVALITGLAFARFARTPPGIGFSPTGRLEHHAEGSWLVLELLNRRHSTVHDVTVALFWSGNGDFSDPGQLEPLALELPVGLPLQRQLLLRHRLRSNHPLLQSATGELLVCFSGIDAILERPVHSLQRYPASAIASCLPSPSPCTPPAPAAP